jgi:hypothetical protein
VVLRLNLRVPPCGRVVLCCSFHHEAKHDPAPPSSSRS